MKTLILSDFTADKAAEAANKRGADYKDALTQHQKHLERIDWEKSAHRRDMGLAWKHKMYGQLALSLVGLAMATLSKKPPPPMMAAAGREELIWASGSEGEARVARQLSVLSDEWTLIKGYHGPKGEIDQILVGPDGLFSIEVKYINGVVHCEADRWWFDKYDRYGNLVESNKPIADRGGRSPSQQLNAATDQLERFINTQTECLCIARIVVLAHEHSRLGTYSNLTVDGIAPVSALTPQWLSTMRQSFGSRDVAEIVQLIERDHHFHANRQEQWAGNLAAA